jgi:hypothetical protein
MGKTMEMVMYLSVHENKKSINVCRKSSNASFLPLSWLILCEIIPYPEHEKVFRYLLSHFELSISSNVKWHH